MLQMLQQVGHQSCSSICRSFAFPSTRVSTSVPTHIFKGYYTKKSRSSCRKPVQSTGQEGQDSPGERVTQRTPSPFDDDRPRASAPDIQTQEEERDLFVPIAVGLAFLGYTITAILALWPY